jgi:hypothetical protein
MRKRKRQRSFGEYYIKQILEKYNVNYIKEKIFSNCNSLKNNPLRFDFYLNDYNILIEFQGKHHYQPVNKYYRARKIYEQTVRHDNIKKEFCIKHNIPLIEINYKDINKIEEVLVTEVNNILKTQDF